MTEGSGLKPGTAGLWYKAVGMAWRGLGQVDAKGDKVFLGFVLEMSCSHCRIPTQDPDGRLVFFPAEMHLQGTLNPAKRYRDHHPLTAPGSTDAIGGEQCPSIGATHDPGTRGGQANARWVVGLVDDEIFGRARHQSAQLGLPCPAGPKSSGAAHHRSKINSRHVITTR